MSMRSPLSSFTTAWTREPLSPTQAPTRIDACLSRDQTAILVRLPRFARRGTDLDDLLLNLGDFQLEQRF